MYLQILALGVLELLEVLVEAELGELVLQVHPEVHVVDRVHDDIDELHARDHKLDVEVVVLGEVLHEGRKSSPLRADLLEVVERREDDLVASFHEADGRQQLQHEGFCSVEKNRSVSL